MEVHGCGNETYWNNERCQREGNCEFVEADQVDGGYWDVAFGVIVIMLLMMHPVTVLSTSNSGDNKVSSRYRHVGL